MSSKHVVGNCRFVRDGWEMAGWLALAISNDFGCDFGSLRDGRDMAGRWLEGTPIVFKHPIQQQRPSTHQKTIQYKPTPQPDGWVVGSTYFKNMSVVNLHIAGGRLGDGWAMARWFPLAISKDCGCNSRSLKHGSEMTVWPAPTN